MANPVASSGATEDDNASTSSFPAQSLIVSSAYLSTKLDVDADLLGGVVRRRLHVAAQRLNEERAKQTASDKQKGGKSEPRGGGLGCATGVAGGWVSGLE